MLADMRNERGSVTILIALLAAVILALGLSFNWLVKEHIRSSESLRDKAEAIIKTRSAYDTLIYLMLTGQVTENKIMISQSGITDLKSIPLDGTEVMIEEGVFVKAQDSNGRLSLTTLNPDALLRLVSNEADPAKAAIFTDSFQDWIDRDDLTRVNGAEAPYYRSHGFSYTPRNYDLQYMEELTLIRGVDADLYKRIYTFLTILPNTGFNPNTASDSVLKAFLSIDDSKVAKIKSYVAKKTIKTMPELVALTGKMFYLEKPEGWFMPSSYLDIIVRTGSPRSLCKISTGLTIESGIFYPYFIHYWQEE
jgi:general secretion pathway protein K